MKNKIIKELIIYAIIVAGLALLMHPDLLSTPSERLGLMQQKGNHTHPLIYSFIIYLAVGGLRALIGWIRKLFKKREENS